MLLTSEPAQIIEKAKSVKVTERDPVTLECTVSGTPELQVKWFKDGKQLMPSRFYTMSLDNNVASFRMESVVKEDSGVYTFKVENDYGSHSCEAVVTVLGLYLPLLQLACKFLKYFHREAHKQGMSNYLSLSSPSGQIKQSHPHLPKNYQK